MPEKNTDKKKLDRKQARKRKGMSKRQLKKKVKSHIENDLS